MPEGGSVRISAVPEDGAVLIQVEDTGPGIAPEIRSKLFQPFVSAGQAQRVGAGTGALAPDRAGPRRRNVGGVGSRPGREVLLPLARR